jgi:L-ascorbate metabolism protein UlaG (beta-lactamase superfamily)
MKIYYLYHSAAAVELGGALLVFDYYRHKPGLGIGEGYIGADELKKASRVYVFVSHNHSDHFNPCVFEWAGVNPETTYILDADVPGAPEGAVRLYRGAEYTDDFLQVRAYGSTDIGVSFHVQHGRTSLFHAGDLNCWHWQDDGDERYARVMRTYFDREMRFIRHGIARIDYAFFPVDKRMGSGYEEGPDKFIEAMNPRVLIPIHFVGFEDTKIYAERMKDSGTKVLPVEKAGQRLV